MTNLTEYDLSTIQGNDLMSMIRSIHEMSNGLLGPSLLFAICIILFSILTLLGDAKTAFYGTSFAALILGFVFLGLQILSPAIFFLIVILVVIVMIIISR